jgi:flagellar biosynthesis/type III secretory pathway M-ring protein FliF/YscJ
LRYAALAALFLVIYLLILRPVKKLAMTAFRDLPGRVAQQNSLRISPAGGALNPQDQAGQLQAAQGEGQRATQLKKMLTDKVKAEPAAASRLVESWVREEKAT